MTDVTARTAWAFQFNTGLLQKTVDGVAPERWPRKPGNKSNSILWIAGHLVWERSQILKLLGQERHEAWLSLFATGAKPSDGQAYPAASEILRAWTEVSKQLASAMDAAPPEVLSRPAPEGLPSADGKLGGVLQFFTIHEGYHLGQLGYLRKWLGYSQVLG
ncbi:MAG: DinB family protein [Acidobacteria bacterium]|nr:MAG: DinB family protein [Acidobacteriota bacterium]